MASQEEQVTDGEPKEDAAKFAGAWDEIEAEETGQSAPAAERQDGAAPEADQDGDEAGQVASSDTPEADADKASRGEISDDAQAGAVSPDDALKASEEARRKAENLARSNGGRLAKALNELHALKATLPAPASGDATEEGAQATTKDEALAKLREDYPEIAEPILEKMAALEARVSALTTSETARAESNVVEALSQEFDELQRRHPDLPELVKAPEYAAWLEGKPPSIKRIVQENAQAVVSVEDAAMVFDLFKAETGFGRAAEPDPRQLSAAERRRSQLDAGRTATGGTQPGVRSDARQDGGSFGDAWDEFEVKDQRKKAASRR
jgi:hypothetical protein